MKRLVIGGCVADNVFEQADPDGPLEAEFELAVIEVLSCLYSDYHCFRFTGGFSYEDDVFRPDLALVARNFSHWFIVEVELVSHSLDHHVLPQVRAFRYGDPLEDCSRALSQALDVDRGNASSLVQFVPRSVVVIANKHYESWETKLSVLGVQLLTVSVYGTGRGRRALELDGNLLVTKESLGFGSYSSLDKSVRFASGVNISAGEVVIADPAGSRGLWKVIHDEGSTWLSKERGTPDIEDESLLQLTRSFDGQLVLRMPFLRRGR